MADISDKMDDAKDKAQETAQGAKDKLEQATQGAKDKASETMKGAKASASNIIQDAKDKLPDITPTPPGLKAQSSVQDLKSRLEWGEPAFTIIDVRDRNTFNNGHIMGAMSMPSGELVERVQSSLETNRDIYVYGESDAETAQAASQLRQAGYVCVAELKGGLAAWKAIGGPTEGIIESRTPAGADDYNVASRVKDSAKK